MRKGSGEIEHTEGRKTHRDGLAQHILCAFLDHELMVELIGKCLELRGTCQHPIVPRRAVQSPHLGVPLIIADSRCVRGPRRRGNAGEDGGRAIERRAVEGGPAGDGEAAGGVVVGAVGGHVLGLGRSGLRGPVEREVASRGGWVQASLAAEAGEQVTLGIGLRLRVSFSPCAAIERRRAFSNSLHCRKRQFNVQCVHTRHVPSNERVIQIRPNLDQDLYSCSTSNGRAGTTTSAV